MCATLCWVRGVLSVYMACILYHFVSYSSFEIAPSPSFRIGKLRISSPVISVALAGEQNVWLASLTAMAAGLEGNLAKKTARSNSWWRGMSTLLAVQ
jgi:hypothetical protein